MRFHVVALSHTNVTREFAACAFTNKVRNFCVMMKMLGHHVTLYGAGNKNEAPCDEYVRALTEKHRTEIVGKIRHYTEASWEHPHWNLFNSHAIAAMLKRIQPSDIICVIGGRSHKPIADAFPLNPTVEFGIGYGGVFSNLRVFESYAWMHMHYGAATGGDPNKADGHFYDRVIPGYIDPKDFTLALSKRGYYLYVGRLIDRKGYRIAQDVCERLGKRLILAGPGEQQGYGEFVGVVDPVERNKLMGGAIALFAPTLYVEPFGNVAIEAMATGTPVISTDWGAFTETVIDGITGFRCHSLAEFCNAALKAPELSPTTIRQLAISQYSLDTVARQYHEYFEHVATLYGGGKGFYAGAPDKPEPKTRKA